MVRPSLATAQSIAICRRLGVAPALFLTPSFGVDGLVKELGLMIESVQPVGMPTQLLGALHDLFVTTSESGHESDDIAAVINAFEK